MVYRSEFFGGGFGLGNGVFVAIGDLVDDAVEEVFYSALVSVLYSARKGIIGEGTSTCGSCSPVGRGGP